MNKLLIVILFLLSLFAPALSAKQAAPTLKQRAKAFVAKTAGKVKKMA